jgi:hypothetical protein
MRPGAASGRSPHLSSIDRQVGAQEGSGGRFDRVPWRGGACGWRSRRNPCAPSTRKPEHQQRTATAGSARRAFRASRRKSPDEANDEGRDHGRARRPRGDGVPRGGDARASVRPGPPRDARVQPELPRHPHAPGHAGRAHAAADGARLRLRGRDRRDRPGRRRLGARRGRARGPDRALPPEGGPGSPGRDQGPRRHPLGRVRRIRRGLGAPARADPRRRVDRDGRVPPGRLRLGLSHGRAPRAGERGEEGARPRRVRACRSDSTSSRVTSGQRCSPIKASS